MPGLIKSIFSIISQHEKHTQKLEESLPIKKMLAHSSSLLHTAAKLNNKAIVHIQRGDYPKAIVILSQAVFSLKKQQIPPATSDQESRNTSNESHLPLFEFVSAKRPQSDGTLTARSSSRTEDDGCISNSSSWYLYDDAVLVIIEQALSLEEATEILAYAVFYNLGLCHHLEALNAPDIKSSSELSSILLERAIVYYSHAQHLLNEYGEDLFLDGDMIQSLAITNNLGHVHHCLNHEPTAKVCFQLVLNAIMLYLSSDSTNNSEGSRGRSMAKHDLCFQGFMTNVLNRLVGSSLHAAAA
jgi:tetratricopeptide (TPR) repeat protein